MDNQIAKVQQISDPYLQQSAELSPELASRNSFLTINNSQMFNTNNSPNYLQQTHHDFHNFKEPKAPTFAEYTKSLYHDQLATPIPWCPVHDFQTNPRLQTATARSKGEFNFLRSPNHQMMTTTGGMQQFVNTNYFRSDSIQDSRPYFDECFQVGHQDRQDVQASYMANESKVIQPQNLTIHQNNLNINLGKHLPNSVKDLGLSRDFQGYSEKEIMDIYVKNLILSAENTDLKEKTKHESIENTRLKQEIKKRDRLILQYIPESIHLLFSDPADIDELESWNNHHQLDSMFNQTGNISAQLRTVNSEQRFNKQKWNQNIGFNKTPSGSAVEIIKTFRRINTIQTRISKSSHPINEQTTDEKNFQASGEDASPQPRLSLASKFKKKKDHLIRKVGPRSIATAANTSSKLFTTSRKPIEFHQKAIVIYLKSVCREQQESLINQKNLYQKKISSLKLTLGELKAQRDAAYSECKKMNRILEEADQSMQGLSQKHINDQVSTEQMNIIVQNYIDKNNQLEKDLKIQILQNELVEEKFIELRQASQALQERMKVLIEDTNDIQQIQNIIVTPSKDIEEQFVKFDGKLQKRAANDDAIESPEISLNKQKLLDLKAQEARLLLDNLSSLVRNLQSNFSELNSTTANNSLVKQGGLNNQLDRQPRKSSIRNKMHLSLLRQQYQRDYQHRVKCFIQSQILQSNADMDADSEQILNVTNEEQNSEVSQRHNKVNQWDTQNLRVIIRRLLPHGDIVLDDTFFQSLKQFKPYLSVDELRDGCLQVLKLVRLVFNERKKKPDSLFKISLLINHIKLHTINRQRQLNTQAQNPLEAQLSKHSISQLHRLNDLVRYLANRSLSSDQYLYVPMLERISGATIDLQPLPTKIYDLTSLEQGLNQSLYQTEQSLKNMQDPTTKINFNCLISLLVSHGLLNYFFDLPDSNQMCTSNSKSQLHMSQDQAHRIHIVDALTFKNILRKSIAEIQNGDSTRLRGHRFFKLDKKLQNQTIENLVEILRVSPKDSNLGRIDVSNLLNLQLIQKFFCKNSTLLNDTLLQGPQNSAVRQSQAHVEQQQVVVPLQQHIIQLGLNTWLEQHKRLVIIKLKGSRDNKKLQDSLTEKQFEIINLADFDCKLMELILAKNSPFQKLYSEEGSKHEIQAAQSREHQRAYSRENESRESTEDCRVERIRQKVHRELLQNCMLNQDAILLSKLLTLLQVHQTPLETQNSKVLNFE